MRKRRQTRLVVPGPVRGRVTVPEWGAIIPFGVEHVAQMLGKSEDEVWRIVESTQGPARPGVLVVRQAVRRDKSGGIRRSGRPYFLYEDVLAYLGQRPPKPRKPPHRRIVFYLPQQQIDALRREASRRAKERGSRKVDAGEILRELIAQWMNRGGGQ